MIQSVEPLRGDTIVAITRTGSGAPVSATRTIDAGGRFVIPALWDMHVHFGGGPALIAENRALLPLYTAHGVVAVRDAAGDLSPSVFGWRDSIARGLSDLGRGSPPTDAGLASVIVANRLAELIGFAGANEAVHAAESEAEQQARELLGLRLIDLSELESVSKRLCSRMVC